MVRSKGCHPWIGGRTWGGRTHSERVKRPRNVTMSEFGTNSNTREIAERLLSYEAGKDIRSGADALPAVHVCQKLIFPLSKLVGETGSRALLARALTLAKREAEVLSPVKVTDEGALEEWNGETESASTLLVGHLLGLVVTFLGEDLTLRLLHDVWPDRTISDVHFGERNGNEPAK